MFAAIGSDGLKSRVWGVGPTLEEAVQEARIELMDSGRPESRLEVLPVTFDQAFLILRGVTCISELGITVNQKTIRISTKHHGVTAFEGLLSNCG